MALIYKSHHLLLQGEVTYGPFMTSPLGSELLKGRDSVLPLIRHFVSLIKGINEGMNESNNEDVPAHGSIRSKGPWRQTDWFGILVLLDALGHCVIFWKLLNLSETLYLPHRVFVGIQLNEL